MLQERKNHCRFIITKLKFSFKTILFQGNSILIREDKVLERQLFNLSGGRVYLVKIIDTVKLIKLFEYENRAMTNKEFNQKKSTIVIHEKVAFSDLIDEKYFVDFEDKWFFFCSKYNAFSIKFLIKFSL